MGLLITTVVVPANYSDHAGGMTTIDRATSKTKHLSKVWHDADFKKTVAKHCRKTGIASEVVERISPNSFEVVPRRSVVARTWGRLTNHGRLRIDHERDPTTPKIHLGSPLPAAPRPSHRDKHQPGAQHKLTRQPLIFLRIDQPNPPHNPNHPQQPRSLPGHTPPSQPAAGIRAPSEPTVPSFAGRFWEVTTVCTRCSDSGGEDGDG